MNTHTLLSKRIQNIRWKDPLNEEIKHMYYLFPFPEKKVFYIVTILLSNIEIISLSVPLLAVGSWRQGCYETSTVPE